MKYVRARAKIYPGWIGLLPLVFKKFWKLYKSVRWSIKKKVSPYIYFEFCLLFYMHTHTHLFLLQMSFFHFLITRNTIDGDYSLGLSFIYSIFCVFFMFLFSLDTKYYPTMFVVFLLIQPCT